MDVRFDMLPAYYYVLLLGGIAALDLQGYTAIEVRGRFSSPEVRLLLLDADGHRNRDGNHGRDDDY